MDPEISILYCSPCPQGIPQRRVRVQLSPMYQRRSLPPPLEEQILLDWEERQRKQPWVFNGAKFRLHSVMSEGDKANQKEEADQNKERIKNESREGGETESDMDEGGGLTLHLALTSYRDFLGTNWSGEARALQERGAQEHGDTEAYLAHPLGVGAALQCKDGCFVLLRRSHRVGEAAGLLDVPGGHPEPKAEERERDMDVLYCSHHRRLLLSLHSRRGSAAHTDRHLLLRLEEESASRRCSTFTTCLTLQTPAPGALPPLSSTQGP
ncbi:uridine diphosphate glucose pyrophosphatase NUDT22 isoform X2 [Pseudophryne corroboree]|uniref:uridine diphosphate glucose pyrophosphatase NUDT22 isoform X2 n=1 Tax=Pseudophryne corroboree TaxID=495146 RepID=UPI0030815C6F